MDALKAEIERKRKEREELGAAGGGKKKWAKRGEIEKARVAQYHADENREAKERESRLVVPCLKYANITTADNAAAAAVEEAAEDSSGEPNAAGNTSSKKSQSKKALEAAKLKPSEVKRLLRQLLQPIQLFGEDDEARLERYQAVSAALPTASEANLEFKKGQMFNETQVGTAMPFQQPDRRSTPQLSNACTSPRRLRLFHNPTLPSSLKSAPPRSCRHV